MKMRLIVSLTLLCVLNGSSPSFSFGHEGTHNLLLARLADSKRGRPTPVGTGPSCRLTIEVVDKKTGKPVSGLVRVLRADGTTVALEGLYDRGITLEESSRRWGWHVIHGRATVPAPQAGITVEAISGIETELASLKLDLQSSEKKTIRFELKRFFDAHARGLRSANTHLHIMKLSRKQSDRYLREVPRGDQLDLLFVSHLERFEEDATYITNEYSAADLKALSGDGLLLGNGEEHRHNFEAYGEGYGHVMLLDINELIQPVSIGPGITKEGHDGIPLRRGINKARQDGATAIFCHNAYGFEDVPDWVSGILDAHNIFDGNRRDSYEDTFYRFLNIGLKVPFSTGTDWFIYDFSRVYVPIEGELTVKKWLHALRQGRSFITNGTFLDFTVRGRRPGDTVMITKPGPVLIHGRGIGRNDFKAIELIHNGRVAATTKSRAVDGHFEATLHSKVTLNGPGWFALRIPDSGKNELGGKNELEARLFAHTSPIYVEMAEKKSLFMPEVAQGFVEDMRQSIATISEKGKFESAGDRDKILAIYREGIATLEKRLAGTR